MNQISQQANNGTNAVNVNQVQQVGNGTNPGNQVNQVNQVTNGTGAIHGGAIVSLCDTAFYVALASLYGPDQNTATAALSCNFLRPAKPPHDLIADAIVLKSGRRICYGEVHVRSGDKLVAHATLNFIILPGEWPNHANPQPPGTE